MGFYEEISKYYDNIFPIGNEQIAIIMETAGKPPKAILDVACGTGGYSLELAKQGYLVTAVDIDAKMVEAARDKAKINNVEFNAIQANMLTLTVDLAEKYDLIFCIGNSIVHLGGLNEIEKFLSDVKSLLKVGGSAIFQIINYDRVMKKGITSLPTITDETIGLCFERMYELDRVSGNVLFNTILKVNNEKIENSIPLYPLLSNDFLNLIKQVGFINIELFGDFKGSKYDTENSYMTVLRISE